MGWIYQRLRLCIDCFISDIFLVFTPGSMLYPVTCLKRISRLLKIYHRFGVATRCDRCSGYGSSSELQAGTMVKWTKKSDFVLKEPEC